MQPTKGLFNDVRPVEQPKETYPYAKNGVLDQGYLQNEPGFAKIQAVIPYIWNGKIETDNKLIVFSTDNVHSAIGYFNPDTEAYEPIFNDATENYKLGFRTDRFITGAAQRNYKGEIVCAFTDKHEFPKWINCDAPSVQRLSDWNLFPYYQAAQADVSIDPGGRVYPGAYYVATRYLKTDGTITPFSAVSAGRVVQGSVSTSITDKSLSIKLSGLDYTSYDYVEVAVISKVGGISKAVLLEPLPINASTAVLNYTGENITTDISIEEITTPSPVYNKVGCMGQLNDALYIAVLEQEQNVNLQKYVNLIKVEVESSLENVVGPSEDILTGKKKGMMHEEVYALYARFTLTRGGTTKAFIIPGNDPLPADLAPSTLAQVQGLTALKYQVEDCIHNRTGTIMDTGVWRNQNELYPGTDDFDSSALGGRDLRGKPVLHHRMPSLRYCRENLYSTEAQYAKSKLDVLGLKISNLNIPAELVGIISGYEILYAKRTVSNMLVNGQGLLLHAWKSTAGDSATVQLGSVGTNFGFSADTGLARDTMRFHGFDVLFNKPAIKPTYMSAQYRLGIQVQQYQQPQLESEDSTDPSIGGIRLLDSTTNSAVVDTIPSTEHVRSFEDSFYAPNDLMIYNIDNFALETCFYGRLNAAIPWSYYDAVGETGVTNFLVNLVSLKEDVYNTFFNQSLVSTGKVLPITSNETLFGGDTYVCDYTFHTYSKWGANSSVRINYPTKNIYRFLCESASNINLRYEIPGDEYSKWYPKATLMYNNTAENTSYCANWNPHRDPNSFGYTKDLNALNDILTSDIFSPYKEIINTHPFRIHRGGKLSKQTKLRSWRTFLPLDYYECQKNMGGIVNVEGMEDRLLIHHENALFYTQDKAKLESGLLAVTLGSGDIFQFEPQEASPAPQGYAGTIHQLASIRTPVGYIFPDGKQGEIFMYSGGKLQNISGGFSRFFRDYLKLKEKNIFQGHGITIGWDQRYKRLLLTVRHKVLKTQQRVIPFEDTDEFWGAIQAGDIIQYGDRLIEYMGLNQSNFDCKENAPCDAPMTLNIQSITAISAIAIWAGTPAFKVSVYERTESLSWRLVSVTIENQSSHNLTGLKTKTLYKVVVTKVCTAGGETQKIETTFTTL